MNLLDSILDASALLYALLLFPAPLFWLVIHPAIDHWRRKGNRAYWVALPVWTGTGALLLGYREWLFAQRIERSALTWLAGMALLGIASWLDRQTFRQFHWRRLIGLPELHPERGAGKVVAEGIYSRLRHPRYLEYILTFFGLALLTGAQGIFALAFATVLLYVIVAPLEERELRTRYGAAYATYARAVPRFIPRWRRSLKSPVSA
jgi:protein-S-isoprenylcysteine O-methyltransferase Ste14